MHVTVNIAAAARHLLLATCPKSVRISLSLIAVSLIKTNTTPDTHIADDQPTLTRCPLDAGESGCSGSSGGNRARAVAPSAGL